jgi:oligopeptide/dipeptide ABC transporter ATP-binding protein
LFDGATLPPTSRQRSREQKRRLQMVFQNPAAALNPRRSIGQALALPLRIHRGLRGGAAQAEIERLLGLVELPAAFAARHPVALSGGQRQRVAIARSLAAGPDLLILDEPTSALDVSVQAQILNLLKNLQREFDLTYMFIAHDLDVVRHISDRVAVMYLGKMVELGTGQELYDHPLHPYTGALLSAIPVPNPDVARARKPIVLEGDVPSPINPPNACRFHPRCPRFQQGTCDVEEPQLVSAGENGHLKACHFPLETWPMSDLRLPASGAAAG